jgi:hypothetical protein
VETAAVLLAPASAKEWKLFRDQDVDMAASVVAGSDTASHLGDPSVWSTRLPPWWRK